MRSSFCDSYPQGSFGQVDTAENKANNDPFRIYFDGLDFVKKKGLYWP